MAQQGMPQQEYNQQTNAINQNQAGAVSALSKTANPGAGLAGIVRQANQATGALNAQSADMRLENLKLAMQTRGQLGQEKLAKQQYDKFDKFTEEYNKSAALRGAANQNLSGAINSIGTIAGGLASSAGDTGGSGFGTQPATMGDKFNLGNYNYGSQQGQGGF